MPHPTVVCPLHEEAGAGTARSAAQREQEVGSWNSTSLRRSVPALDPTLRSQSTTWHAGVLPSRFDERKLPRRSFTILVLPARPRCPSALGRRLGAFHPTVLGHYGRPPRHAGQLRQFRRKRISAVSSCKRHGRGPWHRNRSHKLPPRSGSPPASEP